MWSQPSWCKMAWVSAQRFVCCPLMLVLWGGHADPWPILQNCGLFGGGWDAEFWGWFCWYLCGLFLCPLDSYGHCCRWDVLSLFQLYGWSSCLLFGVVYSPNVRRVALESFMDWRTSSVLGKNSLSLSKGKSSTLCCSSLEIPDEFSHDVLTL